MTRYDVTLRCEVKPINYK